MVKFSALSPVTSQKKTTNKLPTKKFWEYFRVGKTVEPFMALSISENGYTSLADGEQKEMKEYFIHTALK